MKCASLSLIAICATSLCAFACSDDSSGSPDGTGGRGSTGGTPGATGGDKATGGMPATGGRDGSGGTPTTGGQPGTGGKPAQYPCGTKDPRETRKLTIDALCGEQPNLCRAYSNGNCTGVLQETNIGCGYVEFVYMGDVQDRWEQIYEIDSKKLVFYSNNGNYSSYCTDPIEAGTRPACAAWKDAECGASFTDAGTHDSGAPDAADAATPDASR
jgi:hypothetical protein